MITLFTALHVIVALLLIGTVLIQQPKSAGGGLFSGTGQSLLGTSGKTFWTKFTTVLAIVFFALCLTLAALPKGDLGSTAVTDFIQKQQEDAQKAQSAAQQPPPSAAGQSMPEGSGKPAPAQAPAPAKAPDVPASKPK